MSWVPGDLGLKEKCRAFVGVVVSAADCGIFGVAVAIALGKHMFVTQQHPSWGGGGAGR